jgi:uncharacterized protein YceK
MSIKYHSKHKHFLLSIVALVLLSGCGLTAVAKSPPAGMPNSVQIQIITADPGNGSVMTLTNPKLSQKLYQLVYNLPQMPLEIACTMELGPHYMLTFLQKHKILGSVLAKREGCRPVTISGEKRDRQATKEFWSVLDQAIYNSSK